MVLQQWFNNNTTLLVHAHPEGGQASAYARARKFESVRARAWRGTSGASSSSKRDAAFSFLGARFITGASSSSNSDADAFDAFPTCDI